MDPVTIVTSVFSCAETASTIAHTVMKVYRRYKDGPEDMRRMVLEATATGAVLRNIGLLLRDTDASASEEFIREALKRCEKSLGVLKTVVGRIDTVPGNRYRRLQQALKDVFTEHQNDIQKALDTLTRTRLELTLAIVGGVSRDVKDVRATARRIEHAMIDDRRSLVVDWMTDAVSDPSDQHIQASELRAAETGRWLFESRDWHDWAVSGETKAIWINGIAGAGKTMLVSRVVDELFEMDPKRAAPRRDSEHPESSQNRIGITYYYCDASRSQDESTPALRWMVGQLCRLTNRQLPAAITARYRNRGHLDGKTLLQCLESMQDWFADIFVVVDGIDQSTPYHNLLTTLSHLASDRFPKVRVAVASRHHFDIETRLSRSFRCVSMDEHSNPEDIKTYVYSTLHSDGRFLAWSDELRGEIGNVLVSNARGMFRWVGCQLDELAGLHEPAMIKYITLESPKTLDSMYERMLAQIPPTDRDFAILVLTVVIAHESLFDEAIGSHLLLQIVVWNMGRRQNGPGIKELASRYDVNSIRRVCTGLIRLVEPAAAAGSTALSLVHPSLAVFLGSDRLRDSRQGPIARYYLAEETVRSGFVDMALASLQQGLGSSSRTPRRGPREIYFRSASDEFLRQWESHIIAVPELLQPCNLLVGLEEFEGYCSSCDGAAPASGDGNIEAAYNTTYPPSSANRRAFGFLAAADRQLWKMAQSALAELGTEALTAEVTIQYSDSFRLWKQSRYGCRPPTASNPQRHQARSAEPLTGSLLLHCSRWDLMKRPEARKLLVGSLEPQTDPELLLFAIAATHIHPQCKGQKGGCLMRRLISKGTVGPKKVSWIWITPLQVAVARHDYAGAMMLIDSGASVNRVGVSFEEGTNIVEMKSFEKYHRKTPLWILRYTTGVDHDLHVSHVDDRKSRSKTVYDPRASLEKSLLSKGARDWYGKIVG